MTASAGSNQIAVERRGNIVTLTIQLVAKDEYAAIELADGICADAKAGHVMLDFETRPAERNTESANG